MYAIAYLEIARPVDLEEIGRVCVEMWAITILCANGTGTVWISGRMMEAKADSLPRLKGGLHCGHTLISVDDYAI
jgi:hypothetical protein